MNRVLIVDDEASIRETLSEFLLEEGFEVHTAADAAAARFLLAELPFDVVLSDIILPGESGVQVMRHVRAVQPNAQVILVTGEPTLETATDALRSGAFDYLAKPVNQATAVRAVKRAAHVKALEDENRAYRERLEELLEQRTAEVHAERRRKEEETTRLEQQLLQSQRLETVGRLAGGVAHDFNNLLTAIDGYSDLILESLDRRDPIRDDVEEIRAAASRAAWLTSQLLAFSRRQVVVPRVISLNEVVDVARKMLERIIGEDVRLSFTPANGLWPVEMDPGQVDQVLVNLATNARDAMPTGGELHLETANVIVSDAPRAPAPAPGAAPGEYVVLRVRDGGCGMDEETLAHLFEPFFSTKEQGKGSGLGLSTVYGIVKQNGGFINVRSRPEEGTVFEILLPRSHGATRTVAMTLPDVRPRGTEMILLVEDDASVRRLVTRILERQGYGVLEAEDGPAALRHCRSTGGIDLLLTDVILPGMDGPTLCCAARDARPALRVLLMSGYSGERLARHGGVGSGLPLLPKPFSAEQLLARVRSVLDAGDDAKEVS